MGGLGTGYQLDPTKANYNADPTVTARDRVLMQQRQAANVKKLRESGYKTGIDANGNEYDYRKARIDQARGGAGNIGGDMSGTAQMLQNWSDEDWKNAAEGELTSLGIASPLVPPENKKPVSPDLTDEFLQKARTNMALRLQSTRGRSSTFSQGSMGKLNLNKPVLGGY